MIEEARNTSSIEGEFFPTEALKSSVINKVTNGMSGRRSRNQRAEGVSDLIGMVRRDYHKPFGEAELKYWHETLMRYNLRVFGVG